MRIQSRSFRQVLIIALSISACGGIMASAFYERKADTPDSAIPSGVISLSPSPDSRQAKAPQVTPPLPTSLLETELKAIDGSTFRLADFRGKVLLVNIWATWCGPCRSDIPHLVEISREFGARGVEVIGLTNEDPESDEVKVKDFVEEFEVTYRIAWADQSFSLALMQGQIKNNIPQSFIISPDGRVVKRFIGFSQVETPPKMRQALEEALNEK